jgi:hypothetical protein
MPTHCRARLCSNPVPSILKAVKVGQLVHAFVDSCLLNGMTLVAHTRLHCSADTASGKLLGTAALIIERKFIHSCGKVRG